MKKMLAVALCIVMAMSTVNAFGATTPLTIEKMEGAKLTSGILEMQKGNYVYFPSVDFTNVKSVRMTAEANWTSGWSGDLFEVRIDKPTGEIIGEIDLYKEGKNEFGCNVSVTGKHDLYIISTYGPAGASDIFEISLSDEAIKEREGYTPVSAPVIDDFSDTWAGTSELSRAVADYSEVGGVKEGKEVGLFYWIWNTGYEDNEAVINNTTFQLEFPDAYKEDGYLHPAWPKGKAEYFWDEPLYGFYAGNDYWVYRKDAELLSEAGVDFLFFDDTNGIAVFRRNMEVFCQAFRDAKLDGVDVPKFTLACNMAYPTENAKTMLFYMYRTFYKPGYYEDLWYYHEGKPLLMGHQESMERYLNENDPEDVKLTEEILDFFTFRGIEGDWNDTLTDKTDKWSIIEKYPMKTYGVDSSGNAETVTVAGGCNKSIETEQLVPMGYKTARGKNYTETFGHIWDSDAYKYNYFFEEQVSGALETDARIMLISSWNEWTVGRQENYSGKFKNSFIDHFDQVNTRDLALAKGGNRDSGFMLMVDAIRKWKGVRPAPTASEKTTIDMANPASWDLVSPTFYNVRGVYDRDAVGYGKNHYVNKTARNNIKTSKVARNDEFIWFTATCESDITTPSGNNWMALYIDADRNRATGWEGYDYKIVNTDVYSFNGTWNLVGKAEQVLSGKQLQIKAAKSLIGMGDITDIEFKWADNSDDSDILNFYITGICAPASRFNYVYSEIEQKAVTDSDREALKNTTVVKAGSSKAVVRGGIMDAFEANTAYGVREIDGTAYVPYTMLKDVVGYGTTRTIYESYRNFFKIDSKEGFCYTTVGTLTGVVDGVDITLTKPVLDIDGIAYVPVTFLFDTFGYDVRNLGNGIFAFGTDIDTDAALRAAELI